MIDKILKDIKGLFKVQDKAKFKAEHSLSCIFLCWQYLFSSCKSIYWWRCNRQNISRYTGT